LRVRPLHAALLTSVMSGLGGQAALVISGIVAARLLGVENRGHLALLNVLPLLISQVGGLGVWLAVTFYVARDPQNTRAILRRLRSFVTGQTAILTLLHVLALLVLFGGESADVQLAALITVPAIPCMLALVYGLAILQGRQRFRALNVCRLAPASLYALLAIGLFVVDEGTLPLVTGCYVASLLAGAATLLVALRGVGDPPSDAVAPPVNEMVRFGTKAVLGSASPTDGFGLDQAAVGIFLSPSALGLYVVAFALTNLPRFVSQSIGMVAFPNVAARLDPRDARRALWRFAAVGISACLATVVALELAAGWLIPFFFGESFRGAVEIARILLISAFLLSVRRILSDAARGAGDPLLGTVSEVASWVVLLPAMIILVPMLGSEGAATALGVASVAGLLTIAVGLARTRPIAGQDPAHEPPDPAPA